TTQDAHFVAERLARGGIGQAGVEADPFRAWIDDWEMAGPDFDRLRLRATGTDFAYDLRLQANGPLIFHGEGGFSVKSADGQASYYYSQPFFAAEGMLTLPEGEVSVTGTAWLDREWSSQPLSEDQTGWDWFSLQFDTGERMMGFLLRQRDGTAFTQATWIHPDGRTETFPDGAFTARPVRTERVAGRDVPVVWQVLLPDKVLDATVTALNAQSWMDVSIPYWEGPVTLTGSHQGRGYLEMTGHE
ncbi:MAG: iron ABC transporter permease, partial [Rubellimicrobium sp.]|nr:iron ABC transporter permease [Rubellimicrobium sp.]